MKASLTIRIWTEDKSPLPDDLPDAFFPHAQRVASLLEDGYLSGQIVDDNFTGWWEIREG